MLSKSKIWGGITGVGLLLGVASGVMAAQMPPDATGKTTQFRQIEQPMHLKVAVTLSGMGLIGLELWWFLLKR